MPPRAEISLDGVVEAVRGSRRYRTVAREVVARLARAEIPHARNAAEAEKRVKRRLHQVFGAYAAWSGYAEAARMLERLRQSDDREALRATCRAIMGSHSSTRERLDIMDELYRTIFRHAGRPGRLLDLACGLNPLAVPWMDLPADCQYFAFDIDEQIVRLVDEFLSLMGVAHLAEVRDVMASPPAVEADLALLLKTIPCLEQQAKGSGLALIQAVKASRVVVSYPTRSLAGRTKGMLQTYRAQFAGLAAGQPWHVVELELSGELIYLIERDGR